ncbi:hypothetical protein N7495_008555 [Penicillium taxi]|uniref:uncharacterized protein n=1 Tax=Penicillium taxi TaxID=168475 RepID=UPI002544E26C|nr:uncharacterized protein N7495_008555 [Penicillium taxi]KAJ5888514.1 hypothetical protein N7495_008555 [Penicillium taxi]
MEETFGLLPPPQQTFFCPRDEAIAQLNDFTKGQGYSITIKRSNKKGSYLHCSRSGQVKVHVEGVKRTRQTTSGRCDCPFRAVLRVKEQGNRLDFSVQQPTHNHPGEKPILLPVHRQRDISKYRDRIIAYFSVGMKSQAILTLLRDEAARNGTRSPYIVVEDLQNLKKNTKDLQTSLASGNSHPVIPVISPLPSPTPADANRLTILGPRDDAVREYTAWQETNVANDVLKAEFRHACEIALANGLDLEQIHEDKNPSFFTSEGIKIGIARRFVNDIGEWVRTVRTAHDPAIWDDLPVS